MRAIFHLNYGKLSSQYSQVSRCRRSAKAVLRERKGKESVPVLGTFLSIFVWA